jgi:flavin-dependent dehydrogenase
MSDQVCDVLILGGGLAGLTLALQLRQRLPELTVRVLERRRHPVRQAAHKVGESSVEIGAHYFDTVLGLKQHMETQQLRKFGFRFFFSEGRRDLDGVAELGASRYLNTPSYQIDRGIFENYLGCIALERGIDFIDGAPVRHVELNHGTEPHRVRYLVGDTETEVSARWVIDASGRAGILKRKLDLAEDNGHDANAIWFRIGARLDVDHWVDNPDWVARCNPQARWLSTNHLVGPGYWAWLIPLSSGSHSVGIVADARTHPLSTMNSYDKALAWFEHHQPLIAEHLEGKRHLLQDFCALRNFSYGCKQVFSGERWALTGEAGVFLDPFYSPGSDFIAIGNTYITDLIVRERDGESISGRARIYEQLYFSFYQSTLALYEDQYGLFGDPEVLPTKVIWDYTYYWGVLCQLFFHDRLTDLQSISRLSAELHGTKALNFAMQTFFRAWSEVSAKRNTAHLLDQAALPWFAELNRGLRDSLDETQFRERLRQTTHQLRVLAAQIVERATAAHPRLDASAIAPLLGDASADASESLLFAA